MPTDPSDRDSEGGERAPAALARDRRAAAALARLYDLDLLDDPGDVDLYLALAARVDGGEGARILELGVGSGRIAVPLAAAGHDVTGVDVDEAMLARARARAKAAGPGATSHLTLVTADMTADLAGAVGTEGFDLAFLALNSLLLLGDRDRQAAVLRRMADRLAPGGLVVVDVWLPDADDLARYDGRLILEYLRRDPETGAWVTKSASALHDAATASVSLTTIYEEGIQGAPAARWVRRDRLRVVGSDELRRMAEEAGLDVETLAGSYDLDGLRPGDERAILVAVTPGTDTPRTVPARRGARPRPGRPGTLV